MDSSSSASMASDPSFPEEWVFAECLESSLSGSVAASSSFSSCCCSSGLTGGKAASAGCVLCLCGRTLVPKRVCLISQVCVLRLLILSVSNFSAKGLTERTQ